MEKTFLEQFAEDFGFSLQKAGDVIFVTRLSTRVQWVVPNSKVYQFIMDW